MKELPWKG